MVLKSESPAETQKIARDIAQKVIKKRPQKHPIIIALEGEFGAGKTTFVRGFARALGIKEKISSPTFLILRKLEIRNSKSETNPKFQTLVHIDAYRLRSHLDLVPLGVKEIFADPQNIVLIEWAERVKKILPKRCIKVHIDHVNKNTRKISIA